MTNERTRRRIVDAFMGLAAERPFAAIDLPTIAERAGVGLADLRDAFDGRLAILADFSRRLDREVLENEEEPDPDAAARDRLFDVLMRRMDGLVPHRGAVKRLWQAAARDPALAAFLHADAARSMQWMMAAAGVRTGRGRLAAIARVEGLVVVWLNALRAFVDDDEDLGRTMAALDRGLRRGEEGLRLAERAIRPLRQLRRAVRRRGRAAAARRRERPASEEKAGA